MCSVAADEDEDGGDLTCKQRQAAAARTHADFLASSLRQQQKMVSQTSKTTLIECLRLGRRVGDRQNCKLVVCIDCVHLGKAAFDDLKA